MPGLDSVGSDAPGLALSRPASLLSLLVVAAVVPLLEVATGEDGCCCLATLMCAALAGWRARVVRWWLRARGAGDISFIS